MSNRSILAPLVLLPVAAVMTIVYMDWGFGLPFQTNQADTVGNILATLITVSGISIPCVVAYLTSVRHRELEEYVVERILAHLNSFQHTESVFTSAYAALSLDEEPPNPTESSAFFRECLLARRNADGCASLSPGAKKWAMTEPWVPIFDRFFERRVDKKIAIAQAVAAGASASACFLLLMAGHNYLMDSFWFRRFEYFVIFYSFLTNSACYIYLTRFVYYRNEIKLRIQEAAEGNAKTIKNDIDNSRTAQRRTYADAMEIMQSGKEGVTSNPAGAQSESPISSNKRRRSKKGSL